MTDYHTRFLTLVAEIERTYPVASWHVGDVQVWPLARDALYLDLYWQDYDDSEEKAFAARQRRLSARLARAAAAAATPLTNLWRRRSDLSHTIVFPGHADALFLGDGLSFDRVNGAFMDRFCEPLINALHARGRSTLLMQRGDLRCLPFNRPTYAANAIINRGELLAVASRLWRRLPAVLPDHERVAEFLRRRAIPARALDVQALRNKAAAIAATASGFERVLDRVRPSMCFMLTFYYGMGYALTLACRRRGILSVELQRGGLGARHESYNWFALPKHGYRILPAVFWTWTDGDAAAIEGWTGNLAVRWHRVICGGPPQLHDWFNGRNGEATGCDRTIDEIRARAPAEREILVALQGHDGYRDVWNALAALIERTPARWRWWLRRHPLAPHAERELGRLIRLRRPNVLIDEASSLPLPALLAHMDVFVSTRSAAAVEAAMCGLKPIFLAPVAREMFPALFEAGRAEIIEEMNMLEERLSGMPPPSRASDELPNLSDVLSRLESMAVDYSELCRQHRHTR